MAIKSEAQRRKFGELVKQGKMNQSVFDGMNKDTPKDTTLPDRVSQKGPQNSPIFKNKVKEVMLKGLAPKNPKVMGSPVLSPENPDGTAAQNPKIPKGKII